MYSAKVLDYFHHPRNVGEIVDATAAIEATNPVCGDLLKLWAVVSEGRISRASFKVEGCIPAVACASLLTEIIRGKSISELRGITAEQIEAELEGLPSASRHASALAMGGLAKLIEKLSSGPGSSP
jgi:NifU-like protein involved in Fe-S cluster formation